MFFGFNSHPAIRKAITNPHKFADFFLLPACIHGIDFIYRSTCNICAQPSAFIVFNSFFSSLTSRNGEREDFYDSNDGAKKFRQTDFGDGECKINSFDEIEGDGEGEGSDSDNDDSDFMVLNSINRNNDQNEGVRRIEIEEEEFRHPLVREICRLIGLRSTWNPKLEGDLRRLLRSLKPPQVCAVLQSQDDERVALKFFYWADRNGGARRVLRLMARRGIECQPEAFAYVMVAYSRAGKLRNAMQILTVMQKADKVSYYTVMGFLSKDKRIKEVKDLIEKMMKDSKLFPDQVTYNTIIHMLAKHGHADEAVEFLREAEERGFQVDKVGHSAIIDSFLTYTAVVNGLCKVGQVEEAKKMLQQMYKHGYKPNTVSYTALLNGLCRNGKSLEAREMMNMSEEDWWTPNAITYSVVMHGLRREGKLSESWDVVREMLRKGFFPTPVEINLLIKSLCWEGKTVDAKIFMEECLKWGCAVNAVNFTTVIHGFCQNDDIDTALSLLDDMYLNNKHPDAVTYTTIINALGKKGRIEEATEFTMLMLKKGLDPTPVTYRTVIHRYCQIGRVEDLLILLDKMLSRKKCRTAYNQVIEKLCSFGKLEAADKLLGKVLRTASRIDANTCHVLMESYLSKGIPLSSYRVAVECLTGI
ncbi:hypothetical protein GH714_035464 [Hevea brasiliensis]|uniref:Pentatricopeptide repeat-containing protein-mitochondrial domain-containing protein n=1 Tax=Hevea brasiliensis TaxID=3981 RepID=A0A6A6KUA1_HEVBR|nr:hypothetical protein GH714_035464 [Hevea brasiliensis]